MIFLEFQQLSTSLHSIHLLISSRSRLRQVMRHYWDFFSSFFNIKVCCVLSLESPHQYKKANLSKLFQICSYRIISKGLKNEFETAVVNEPSVFEPLKFYCSSSHFFTIKIFQKIHLKLHVRCITLSLIILGRNQMLNVWSSSKFYY